MYERKQRQILDQWQSHTAAGAAEKRKRQQEQSLAAEAVFTPHWQRVREIAEQIKQKYGAPLPVREGSASAYQVYSVVRDILDEFMDAVEQDAAAAPLVKGEDDE
jgi:1-aminocyclopropane-1-carboxylate deaminase/D-cysteine desulfhydrase-like pyridoxal-dependent ACC family enzyme